MFGRLGWASNLEGPCDSTGLSDGVFAHPLQPFRNSLSSRSSRILSPGARLAPRPMFSQLTPVSLGRSEASAVRIPNPSDTCLALTKVNLATQPRSRLRFRLARIELRFLTPVSSLFLPPVHEKDLRKRNLHR